MLNASFLITLLISIFLIQNKVTAKILVIEYTDATINFEKIHGEQVSWVACLNEVRNCEMIYSDNIAYDPSYSDESRTFFETINDNIADIQVVNMSLSLQVPEPVSPFEREMADSHRNDSKLKQIIKYEKFIELTEKRILGFKRLINTFKEKLFVVAAGNGLQFLSTSNSGVALDNKINKFFPAIFNHKNQLTVAAYDQDNDSLFGYSNYGLKLVDIAATVEAYKDGSTLEGTSFSTPLVSRIADKILNENKNLTIYDAKEILMKSCLIKDVEAAIKATQDIKEKGKNSSYYQAMHHRKIAIRDELQEKYSDVTFVKCGGVLDIESAFTCASIANQKINEKDFVSKACIQSHKIWNKIPDNQVKLLPMLWKLRNF